MARKSKRLFSFFKELIYSSFHLAMDNEECFINIIDIVKFRICTAVGLEIGLACIGQAETCLYL